MKGKKKIIVPLLLTSVAASGLVANVQQQQQVQVHAETAVSEITNINGAELYVKPFASTSYNIGDKVFMPQCWTKDGLVPASEVEFTVKKGNKKIALTTVTAAMLDNTSDEYNPELAGHTAGERFFVANYVGYYNVSVSAKVDGRVVSTIDNLSVWVEKQDAVINLPVNSQYVIPAKVPTKQEGLKIPVPTVTVDVDGKEVEQKIGELTTGTSLEVYLNTPSGEDASVTLDSTKSYYTVDKEDLKDAGTYTIVYEYKVGSSVISRLESNFQVVSGYDTSDIKLTMSFLDSMPSTGNVNTDITIPKIKVTNTSSSTETMNAYVKVVVKNVKTGETLDVDYSNYTFHPTEKGFYSVTYVASIPLFGDTCKTSEVTPGDIIEVADKKAPTLIPTYSYDLNDGVVTKVYNLNEYGEVSGIYNYDKNKFTEVVATSDKTQKEVAEELLVNRKVDIPSVAVLQKGENDKKSAKVLIPAAYAIDNFYTYKGGDNKDIVITRTYRTSTGAVHTVSTPANEVAEIEFPTKGNSEIRYKAEDADGNTLGEIVYDIVIYDVDEDLSDGETKIDLNVGTELVSENEKTLTFAKPTVKDTYDSNVEIRTWYELVGVTGSSTELKETNSDGKYEIDIKKVIAEHPSVTGLKIYSIAYVDGTLVNTRGDSATSQLVDTNEVRSDVWEVTILRNNGDTDPATMADIDWNAQLVAENGDALVDDCVKIDVDGYALNSSDEKIPVKEGSETNKAAFDQGKSITLPNVTFNDKDSNLTIEVYIKDKFGNDVPKDVQEKIIRSAIKADDTYDYEISGLEFKLSSYGVYTVTFRAEDYAGNITVKSFGIRVNDKTAPTITVDDEDKFGKEIEVGEYFRVPTARLIKNGEAVKGTINWEITYASGKYTKQPNGFTATSEGTFIIRYTAQDEFGNDATLEDSMFTITAKDSKAPTLELDMTYRMPTSKEWKPGEGEEYMVIDIPVAIATDKLTKKDLEVVYTVSGPNGTKPTVSDYEDKDNVKYFKATSQGTYTVKYSTVDDAGNETTISKEIKVGDCISPTLDWVNKDKDLPTEVKLNESYVLDLNSMVKLEDNETSKEKLLEKIKITLTAPDGSSVSNKLSDGTGYEWQFTQTGSYTLKFVVEDEVGNKNTYTYSITVPSEDAEENKVSPVLGTVLVVLSVVVLAGVVVYFVASSKKKPTKSKTKKSK